MTGRLRMVAQLRERLADGGGLLLAQRRLGLRAQHRQRRAQLVRRVRDEPALHGDGVAHARHELIDGADERRNLLGRMVERERRQIGRRPARHFTAQLLQRRKAALDAHPDDCPAEQNEKELLSQGLHQDGLDQPLAAAHRFGHLRDHHHRRVGGHGGGERGDADALAPVVGVVEERLAGRRGGGARQIIVAGDEYVSAVGTAVGNRIEDAILIDGVEHLQCDGRQVHLRARAHHSQVFGDRQRRGVKRLVVGGVDGALHREPRQEHSHHAERAERDQQPAQDLVAQRERPAHGFSNRYPRPRMVRTLMPDGSSFLRRR